MKLLKKISIFALSAIIATSFTMTAFAKPQSIYAPQNSPDGRPFQPLQLGDWNKDTQGKYKFIYSVEPFEDAVATDKGLVPVTLQGKYENPSKWAEYEVVKAAKMGLSNMDIITQYQEDITRAEFARAIVQAYYKYDQWLDGNKVVASQIETDIFDDIDVEENEDDLAIVHAYYLGIVEGWGGNFHPDTLISRQDMSTMIGRFCELYDINFLSDKNLKNYFQDYKEIRSYAKKYVAGLANEKIFKGYPVSSSSDIGKKYYSNYEFRPVTYTTNEQALCLILRSVERYLDPQVSKILGQPLNVKIDGTKLVWNSIYSADTYEIYMKKYVSDTETVIYKTSRTHTTSLDLDGMLESGVYAFSVLPINEFHSGVESEDVTVIVPHPVEKASIQLVSNANGTARLSWKNVAHFNTAGGLSDAGADKYRIVVTEKGSKKVLLDTKINESTNARSNMVLSQGLVNTVGTYTIKIYALNLAFSSAPVTQDYNVVENDDGEPELEEVNAPVTQ